MSDPQNSQEVGLRARPPRSSRWAREASVLVWLLLAIAVALGLLFWL
jgi:hypothetical protein